MNILLISCINCLIVAVFVVVSFSSIVLKAIEVKREQLLCRIVKNRINLVLKMVLSTNLLMTLQRLYCPAATLTPRVVTSPCLAASHYNNNYPYTVIL